MARGDPIYARVDISLLFDPRIRRLTAAQKWFYQVCYLTSVEARSEQLPPAYDLDALQDRAGIDARTGKNALQKCCEVGLLELDEHGLIRVMGVRENHARLEWNEHCTPSPHGADTGPKREENKTEKREEKQEPAREQMLPEQLVPSLIKKMGAQSEAYLPEKEPTGEQIQSLRERVAKWTTGDLLRHTATASKTGQLTDTLNDALRKIPELDLRETALYVLAKLQTNVDRGWNTKKAAAVLTSRCKTIMKQQEE